MAGKSDEQFNDKEAKARFEAALRGAMNTPPTVKPKAKKANTKRKKASAFASI